MKRLVRPYAIFMVTLLSILLFLSACKEGGESTIAEANDGESEETEQVGTFNETLSEEPIVIGFSMDTLLEERWERDRDMFQEAAEKLGAEVKIMAANGDDALQIEQAETLISQGVDVLVIVPHDADSTAAIVEKAHASGIKVMAYDRLVNNANIDLYVSFDNEEVGELQARAMADIVPKGNYVYIGGAATDNNAHLLKKGVYNVLAPMIQKGDIKVVYDQWSEDWAPDKAKANMEEALEINGEQIDAVIAANDATAGGVIEVLEERGLAGKIPVVGQDAELAGVRRLVNGTQKMTVYKPINLLTETTAALSIKLAKGESVETAATMNNGEIGVPAVLLKPIPVTEANIEETVIRDGFHSEKAIYGTEEK